MTARRQISVSEELCISAEQRFGSQFAGVEEFIEFLLREILQNDPQALDMAEKSVIEKRLRDLGYL